MEGWVGWSFKASANQIGRGAGFPPISTNKKPLENPSFILNWGIGGEASECEKKTTFETEPVVHNLGIERRRLYSFGRLIQQRWPSNHPSSNNKAVPRHRLSTTPSSSTTPLSATRYKPTSQHPASSLSLTHFLGILEAFSTHFRTRRSAFLISPFGPNPPPKSQPFPLVVS